MNNWTHITMFDRPYSAKKQAEGLAISQAIAGGHCEKCPVIKPCSTNRRFKFPESAWCMKRKKEILAEMKRDQQEGGEEV